jgi:hypothetical protein
LYTQETRIEERKGKEKKRKEKGGRKPAVRINLTIGKSAPLNFLDSFCDEWKVNSPASLFQDWCFCFTLNETHVL